MKLKFSKNWNTLSVTTPLEISKLENVVPNTLYEYLNGQYNKVTESYIFPNKSYWIKFDKETEIDIDSEEITLTNTVDKLFDENIDKIKDIYSNLFISYYCIHPDKKTQINISRNYIMLGDAGINFYSSMVTKNNLYEFHLKKELLSLISREKYTEIIDYNNKKFWTSNDVKKIAYNISSYQLNNEYGLWKNKTLINTDQPMSYQSTEYTQLYDLLNNNNKWDKAWEKESGAWPIPEYVNLWINKTTDLWSTKRGEVFLYKDAKKASEDGISEYNGYSDIVINNNYGIWKYNFGSFKNGGTCCFMRFLAGYLNFNEDDFISKVFQNGLDYFYRHPESKFFYEPSSPDISLFINDGAISNCLYLLLDISYNTNNSFSFISNENKEQCENILDTGINMLCDIQLIDYITNKKTGWAQVYNTDLVPVKGRSFEPLAVCLESSSILSLLMSYNKISEKIINSVSGCINFYIENALFDVIYHDNDFFGLTPQQDKSDEPIWGRYFDYWTQEEHEKFLNLLDKYKNIEDSTEKCLQIAEEFKQTIDEKDIYLKNDEQVKRHYERYLNNGGPTIPIFGDMDNGVYTNLYDISYERRKGYTWILKLPKYEIEKYLSWIKEKLFVIENPNLNIISSIVNCVESLKKLLEKSEYKYYSDEEYNTFKEQYSLWCEKFK
jgi:PelA/Pel-15E family pectate lyase